MIKESEEVNFHCKCEFVCRKCIQYMIYIGPPKLQNLEIKILEGTENISVDLGLDTVNCTPPSFISWSKANQFRNSFEEMNVTIRNTTISFDNITRDHAGTYHLNLTKYYLDGKMRNGDGSLTLNVLCKLHGCQLTVCLLISVHRWPRNERWYN